MPELVDMQAVYRTDPDTMATAASSMLGAGATIFGGCCGTTPTHLAAMARLSTRDAANGAPGSAA